MEPDLKCPITGADPPATSRASWSSDSARTVLADSPRAAQRVRIPRRCRPGALRMADPERERPADGPVRRPLTAHPSVPLDPEPWHHASSRMTHTEDRVAPLSAARRHPLSPRPRGARKLPRLLSRRRCHPKAAGGIGLVPRPLFRPLGPSSTSSKRRTCRAPTPRTEDTSSPKPRPDGRSSRLRLPTRRRRLATRRPAR